MKQPRKDCGVCGRNGARRRGGRTGKAMFPHCCPHGRPCVAGDRLLGLHANNPGLSGTRYYCADCWHRHNPDHKPRRP